MIFNNRLCFFNFSSNKFSPVVDCFQQWSGPSRLILKLILDSNNGMLLNKILIRSVINLLEIAIFSLCLEIYSKHFFVVA